MKLCTCGILGERERERCSIGCVEKEREGEGEGEREIERRVEVTFLKQSLTCASRLSNEQY